MIIMKLLQKLLIVLLLGTMLTTQAHTFDIFGVIENGETNEPVAGHLVYIRC